MGRLGTQITISKTPQLKPHLGLYVIVAGGSNNDTQKEEDHIERRSKAPSIL